MPKSTLNFTQEDVGCLADGAYGHDHVRSVLAGYMELFDFPMLADELTGPMPDDASDEDDALDILNTACEDGVYIDFVDGDVVCVMEDSDAI